ncbi:hypothetical protein HA461_03975 [Rhizobium leguminosarum bv. trifolii]|nr:hypothetical protein HA461_03975 [Rhizobium leguminosarum bv. trifolii]
MGKMVATETLEQIWGADRLDRRQDADFLYNFITGEISKRKSRGKRSSYSLNIDAQWGGGKSFFLERFGKQAELRGHVVAYVNAWQDDHAGDPYIAIMAAIDRAFAPYVKKDTAVEKALRALKSNGGRIALNVAAGAARSLVKKHLDLSSGDILGEDEDPSLAAEVAEVVIDKSIETGAAEVDKLFSRALEAMIQQFQKADKAIQSFREKLATAAETLDSRKSGKKAPFFILVDELDRCRPSYAVHLLERIKHLFEVDGVAFVFATNSQQLQYSIIGAYGQGFDGHTYLRRFFERTYLFSEVSPKRRIEELCGAFDKQKIRAPERNNIVEFITSGYVAYGLDLRAIEQILEAIEITASAWPHKIPLDLLLLFPLCVSFQRTSKVDWNIALREIPDHWVIGQIFDDKYRGVVDRQINVKSAFSKAMGRFRTMDGVFRATRDADDSFQEQYVRQTFEPEWNGVSVDGNTPSIQTQLSDLLANAGRLMQPVLDDQEPV